MHGIGIGGGMHGHGGETEFAAGALDAQSNLAAIGNQNLLKHFSTSPEPIR
jgi:hypothetical protein